MRIPQSNIIFFKNQKIIDAMTLLNQVNDPILIFINSKKKLLGTLTDGDIRRYLLRDGSVNDNVKNAIKYNPRSYYKNTSYIKKIFNLIEKFNLVGVPILNRNKTLYDVIYAKDKIKILKNLFVIMAGGRGFRMMPLTTKTPKSLIKFQGETLISQVIDKAILEGFKNFVISLGYMGNKIEKFLKKKYKNTISIDFKYEKKPLGTAGALSFLSNTKDNLIVSNTDVITDLSYRSILDFHQNNNADITVGSKIFEDEIPYGILKTNKSKITSIVEKPRKKYLVNAGIYVINPKLLSQIKKNKYLDMTTYIEKNLKKKKIITFPIYEKWQDIGTIKDLND